MQQVIAAPPTCPPHAQLAVEIIRAILLLLASLLSRYHQRLVVHSWRSSTRIRLSISSRST